MTSSSKLFHTRRIRFGARNNSVADTPSDSSLPARTTTDRRNHHRDNRHHLSTHGISEHDPSGSIINSEDFRSIRRFGATENDRLPGVVLLARERLLERLRGVHVSENRQSDTSSSVIHQDDSSYHNFLETNSRLNSRMPLSAMTRMIPMGLSEHEVNLLSVTVFKEVNEESNESYSALRECSICLEGFEDGERLIKLPCKHRFHSGCLLPWAGVRRACPNCRKDIAVSSCN